MADELRALMAERRQELGLGYQSLASVCVDTESGTTASSSWLHRLETGAPVVPPSAEVLAALAAGVGVELVRLQEAAAAQFFGLHLQWENTGEAAEFLAALAVLPDGQRRAILDLVRVMAKDR